MIENLSFGMRKSMPVFIQAESAECGIACLAMISSYYGLRYSLQEMRSRISFSASGATLAQLIAGASSIGLSTRAVTLEVEELKFLKLPSILHWNFNHFVVLKKVKASTIVVHDPAFGERSVSIAEASAAFTGVATEIWPNKSFKPRSMRPRFNIKDLLLPVHGLLRCLSQVVLLALTLELLSVLMPFYFQIVVDKVVVSADYDLLIVLALGFAGLQVLMHLMNAGRRWALMYIGATISAQWKINIFTHLMRLPVSYFERRNLGDVLSRFGSIDEIQKSITTSFIEGIIDGVMALITLILIFAFSAKLAGIVIAGVGLYSGVRWLMYAPLRTASEQEVILAARQETHFLESVRGIRTLKLFQNVSLRSTSWSALLIAQMNADLTGQKIHMIYEFISRLIFGLVTIISVWIGALAVISGELSVGMLIAFNIYKDQFNSRIQGLIDNFIELRMLNIQAERLADIVTHQPDSDEANHSHIEHESGVFLEVRDLSYTHQGAKQSILKDVSFKVFRGDFIAIVGQSGSGKTTLLNLLLGIVPPQEGGIYLGGVKLGPHNISLLLGVSGTVLQDDVLFAGSIADNISFFDISPDMSRIVNAAKIAAVHEDIENSMLGYSSLVGDMGSALSGGQKQRILLARALYKAPKLLFLDEATSHLDVVNESKVNTALKELDLTIIVVAHRPETIKSASRVLSLTDGEIREKTIKSIK